MVTARPPSGSTIIRTSNRPAFLVLALIAVMAMLPARARAQMGSDRYSSIVIDAGSGRVLSAMDPDEPRHPASLTKMMTLFMLFEALRDRRLTLDQAVPVSAHAASMVPSKLGLVPGSQITVEQAILGLVTKSANDAASALGELMGGDESRFAQMMTLRARALGMKSTEFHNASGLPDPDQITTARDMALLARHLVQDFPTEYRYFSVPGFAFHGRMIPNHDRMLQTYPGADGLKTGYVEASGHNLVTSAVRSDVRLIGVVLGAGSNAERDMNMRVQLDDGFTQLDVPNIREASNTSSRFPGLIPSAKAATLPARGMTLPPRPAVRLAELRASAPPARQIASWTIQVGAFPNAAAARRAVQAARIGGEPRVEQAFINGRPVWRAQVVGLRQGDAIAACANQARRGGSCSVLNPDQPGTR
jgi:D-alanyl-D-alanine carboxypeptidase